MALFGPPIPTSMRGVAGEPLLFFVVVLVVLAGITQQPALLLTGFVLGVLLGLTALWRRWCLRNIEYRRILSDDRAFPGETVELRIQTANRKLLPLPWLEVEDEFPAQLGLTGGRSQPTYKPLRLVIRNLLSLRWYEQVTKRYRVECRTRGYYSLGPARVRSGDIFGFFADDAVLPAVDHLLVYPRVVPLEQLGIASREPFGGSKARQWLLQDPLRIAGVREYTPGDSLRRIHWKASARSGALQVKLQEPSTMLDLLLFLNVSTVLPEWQGSIPELLEEAVTVTASVASHVFEQGYRVGLYVNTNAAGTDQQMKLPPGRDPDQLARILEALAKVTGFATISTEQLLVRESRNLPWGATVVLVSAATSEGALAALIRMRRAGRRVALLQAGSRPLPAGLEGLSVLRVQEASVPSPSGRGLG